MQTASLIKSINDWREFYLKQLKILFPRRADLNLPDFDMGLGLVGLRRSGKTSLAIQLSNKINSDRVLYYNLEDPLFSESSTTEDLDLLIETAEEIAKDKIELLILDEIHNVPRWEKWLRKLIDLKKYRIITTGSSAKLIDSELATALTGRTITKNIWSLSLAEYRDFNIRLAKELTIPKLSRDYLTFGGFPGVALQADEQQKKELLRSYLNDILLKDVVYRHSIRNANAIKNLATYLITNPSSLHSSISIERALGIEKETALLYVGYLCDAFLINRCELFSNNLKVQQRAATKFYLSDLGLRLVGARSVNDDDGKLLENLVYLEFQRKQASVYYHKNKFELDFLVTDTYKPEAAYQVCFSLSDPETRTRELRGLIEAAETYKINQLFIITWNEEDIIKISGQIVKVLPVARFCNLE